MHRLAWSISLTLRKTLQMNSVKQQLYDKGVDTVTRFFEHNDIDLCPVRTTKRSCHYGFYGRHSGIVINLDLCRAPTKTPGYSWSYPCFKSDCTPIGVIAHEAGHHISATSKLKRKLEIIWAIVCDHEPYVTSYDGNHHDRYEESFAESVRLFILNPDLLRLGRPKRYDMLLTEFKLQPIETRDWAEVLSDAHPKFLQAAINWIRKGIK